MVNFGLLMAKIDLGVWGTPTNFNGFRVLSSLLQRRRSPDANQTLHDVWPSPGLVHYIYIFGGSCPLTEFCPVQNSLYVQVFHCHILATLVHGTPAVGISKTVRMVQGMEVRNFHRRRHRYSAGRPSRWALAHILVMVALWNRADHYIFILFLSSSSLFSSPNLSGRRLDVYHTSAHGVAFVRI